MNLEAEYAIRANKAIHGLGHENIESKGKSLFVKTEDKYNKKSNARNPCKTCEGLHKIWDCSQFKSLNVDDRWKKAKEEGLCFRCLKGYHTGREFRFRGKCEINNCDKSHNRLLHKDLVKLNVNASEYHPPRVATNV